MALGLLSISIFFALVSQIQTSPVDFTQRLTFTGSKSEKSWLWGWAWGTESTVSIVDRSPILSFPSRPAAFGVELGDPLLGYVIPLSSFVMPCESNDSSISMPPNLGCPKLCVYGPEPTETWIALVQRGTCSFVSKVREAQRLGAKGVVVGGDNPEVSGNPDALVNMYSPGTYFQSAACIF